MKLFVKYALLFVMIFSFSAAAQNAQPQKKEAPQSKNAPKFDPARDSEKDLAEAVANAKVSGKFILLDVGGERCIWCKRLDVFLYDDPEIHKMMKDAFEVVKVNMSQENKNEAILSKYPKIGGYPHFFILDKNGKFVQSQDTAVLESKGSYSPEKLKAFFTIWTAGK